MLIKNNKEIFFLFFCYFIFADQNKLEQKKEEKTIIENRLNVVKEKMTKKPTEKDFESLKTRLVKLEYFLNNLSQYPEDKNLFVETMDKYKNYKKYYDAQMYEIQKTTIKEKKKKGFMSCLSLENLIDFLRKFIWADEIKRENFEKTIEILEKRKEELEKEIQKIEKTDL